MGRVRTSAGVLVVLLAGGVTLWGCAGGDADGGDGGGDDGAGALAGEAAPSEALCSAEVLVFLQPGLDEDTTDEVATTLDEAAVVDRVVLLDEEQTEPIHQALFADVAVTADPAERPRAFAVELRNNVDATLFVGDLYATEGVGEVAPVDGRACQIVSGELDPGAP